MTDIQLRNLLTYQSLKYALGGSATTIPNALKSPNA